MIRFFILLLAIVLSHTAYTHAAELSFSVGQSVTQDKVFPVDVVFTTGGETINSIDIAVAVSDPSVRLMGYQESGSLVKLWIRQPTMTGGVVYFSGSIPGGAQGMTTAGGQNDRISLVRLLFSAPTPGTVIFSIPKSTVLLHDGKGTVLPHTRTTAQTTVVIAPKKESVKEEPLIAFEDQRTDSTPPEPIRMSYIPSSLFDRTPSMIQFATTDAESGIARYDIRIKGQLYDNAQSPFVVPKKILPYSVTVIAYDIAGNTTTAVAQVPGVWSLFSILVLGVLGIAGFWLHTMVKKKI